MKLLSFQPFSIYDAGGGSRILRRLFQNENIEICSVGITQNINKTYRGDIPEVLIELYPPQKKWARSFIRRFFSWLRKKVFLKSTIKQIQKHILEGNADILHIIDHDIYSKTVLTLPNKDLKLWTSFHDHFLTSGGSFTITGQLWMGSTRRLVISQEMGLEYQRLFGEKKFEVITDGVSLDELSEPKDIQESIPTSIYFAGLLHIDYIPLFMVLADSLDVLAEKRQFKLILRGTQQVNFLANRKFVVEYLPLSMDNELLKQELDAADLLYLPIKFTIPEFYKYSLSTKMIGYLGGAGCILYHGPSDSAACNLLRNNQAALICTSLEISDLTKTIVSSIDVGKGKSINAKKLAQEQFLLEDIMQTFWQENSI